MPNVARGVVFKTSEFMTNKFANDRRMCGVQKRSGQEMMDGARPCRRHSTSPTHFHNNTTQRNTSNNAKRRPQKYETCHAWHTKSTFPAIFSTKHHVWRRKMSVKISAKAVACKWLGKRGSDPCEEGSGERWVTPSLSFRCGWGVQLVERARKNNNKQTGSGNERATGWSRAKKENCEAETYSTVRESPLYVYVLHAGSQESFKHFSPN